ncbi:protein kinase domain-containing protein [Polyangium mundeleinium]|uniref:Protein kinase n=1 Tax=Polyangium mundeleinium TaxID=2995306 RepID=A0ABT5EMF9_9BACT|nr:protein kinase [Polyangium mundeleinium]MDC0742529.1 protein kinase [Polyangium mundeleinium]
MRLCVGDIVDDRFEIERVAGAGGMATVYRALDRHTGLRVALKRVRDEDTEMARRFDHEVQSLAELRHPHVVRYVAHGSMATGGRWLAMEWLEGEDLAARLTRGRLSIEDTIKLGARVARALEAAHHHEVIHRDIKPSNLLLIGSSVEEVRLIDFGIAQTVRTSRRVTESGMTIGTPGYMAPEQARGETPRVDGRADLFSLGAVLFECVTGRPAFEGTHVMALLARLLFEEVPRLRDLRPETPRALDELVASLLAKDPDGRPRDAGVVARALESMDVDRGSMRPPPGRADLGHTERRLFSIVAVLPHAPEETGPRAEPQQHGNVRVTAIEQAVRPFGAHASALANGALFVTLSGEGSASDLAIRAARAALALRPLLPPSAIALVTGLGEADGKAPIGEIAERAVVLLKDGARHAWGSVLMDEVTAALLDGRFAVALASGDFVLEGEREAPAEARTLLGRASPYLGRDRELRMIEELVHASFDEREARAVLVIGAAGMGKSRLRREVETRIAAAWPDAVIELGRGDLLGQGSPFSVIAAALQHTARITAGEPFAVRRQKLEDTFGKHLAPDRQRHVLEFLGEMVGIPYPDDQSPKLRAARQSAALMADRIREVYVDLLAAELSARPRLLVLEDLQWGDAASIKLVDAALRALPHRPFVVLALGRPEVRQLFPRLWEQHDAQEIRLRALSGRAATELVRHYMGDRISAEEIDRVVARAGGNAFYLEELVRAVAEGRGGEVPETALGLVESRLAALGPEERRLLRVASVFGEAFWADALATVAGEPLESVTTMLACLEARELAFRRKTSRFSGRVEYAFRHSLLQEGSYATLTERDRALAHARAGAWLLAAGEKDPKVLAEHFGRAGDASRAIGYYVRAAEQSLAAGDNKAAVSLADAALGLGAAGADAAVLRAIQTDAWTWSCQYVRAHEAAQVALFLAEPGSLSHIRALGGVISNGLMLRRFDVLGDAMAELLHVVPQPEAIPALAWAFTMAMNTQLLTGQWASAKRYLRRMEDLSMGLAAVDPSVMAWLAHAQGCWARHVEQDLWDALELHRLSARGFREAGDQRYGPHAEIHVASLLLALGAFEEASALVERALAASPPGSQAVLLGRCVLSSIALDRGAIAEGIRLGEAVAKEADALDEGLLGLYARLAILEARVEGGDLDDVEPALVDLEPAVKGMPLAELWHTTVRAAARLSAGRADEAQALCEEALAQGEALGVVDHRRRVALGLVLFQAFDALGERGKAVTTLVHLKEATEAQLEKIADPALRESYLGRVPVHVRLCTLLETYG